MGRTKETEYGANVVDFSEQFFIYYSTRYSQATVDNIDAFIDHFTVNGLFGDASKGQVAWIGKISPSWNVPENYSDEDKIAIEKYARKNKLWHVHIGEPCFADTFHGKYKTSEWVLHFQKFSDKHIKLLELGYHSPMGLPKNIT